MSAAKTLIGDSPMWLLGTYKSKKWLSPYFRLFETYSFKKEQKDQQSSMVGLVSLFLLYFEHKKICKVCVLALIKYFKDVMMAAIPEVYESKF